MPRHETRYMRNGVPVPIQCLLRTQKRARACTDRHYHDYIELLYGVKGYSRAYVGANTYDLVAGSLIMIRSGELHDVCGTGVESDFIVVKFLPSVLFAEEQTLSEYTYALLLMQHMQHGKIYFEPSELADTPIGTLFEQLLSEWEEEKFGYELSLRAGVTSVMLHIMRKWREETPSIADYPISASQSELIQGAINYIETHYADLTEETCAHALGVSSAYLSRIFKKGMKSSFVSYVNSVKLKAAEKLLHTSDLTMTEIAERVGFSTIAYFIATFRKRYHMTPNQYRKILHGQSAE